MFSEKKTVALSKIVRTIGHVESVMWYVSDWNIEAQYSIKLDVGRVCVLRRLYFKWRDTNNMFDDVKTVKHFII